MKNIQAQYQDLLEGKMTKANFMRNVRMGFPQYVSNTTSYEDSVNILKGKRILSEAKKPIGVYGHNPNAEAEVSRGIDHLNYYQVYHGIQYELAKMPEITDETYIAARKKVVDNILKDPDAYKELQLANFKAVKEMDEDLEMKEVKKGNLVDKPNEMKVVKKDAGANTQATLEKKEKKKAKNGKGLQHMTQAPKKVAGVQAFETPGKEKVLALKEHILDEMTKINPEHEFINVGSRVKKKGLADYDPAGVGNVTEFDGDTATVKWDDDSIQHVQSNILTKKDIPQHPKAAEKFAQISSPFAKEEVEEGKDSPHSVRADQELDQSALKFLKSAFKDVPSDKIPEKHRKRIEDLEAGIKDRKDKFAFLKEKLTKAIKELLFRDKKTGKVQSFQQNDPAMKDPQFNQVFTKA